MLFLNSIVCLLTFINFIEVKKTTSGHIPPLWTIPILVICILLLPIGVTLVTIFLLYREFIGIILRFKHGEKFGGFLNGADAFQTTGRPIDHIINSFLVYKCPRNTSFQTFQELFRKELQCLQMIPKFNVTFANYSGYSYMLKKKPSTDEIFKLMKVVQATNHKLTKPELMSLLDEYTNSDLPNGNTYAFEVLIGTQLVDWGDDDYNYYPVLCRYHHALADGVTLIKMLVSVLVNTEQNITQTYGYQSITQSSLKLSVMNVAAFLLLPAWYVSSFVLRGKDRNILKGPKLACQNYNMFQVEHTPSRIAKIKRIKNKISGVSFSDVLLTAISASIDDYFKKKSVCIDKITAITPVLVGSTELSYLKGILVKDLAFTNHFSIFTLDFPVHINNTSNKPDLVNRLNLISNQNKHLRTSFQSLTNWLFVSTVFAYIPQQLLKPIAKSVSCTATLSMLPGSSRVTCLQGMGTLAELIPMTPRINDIGLTVLIHTYDDRLQVCVSVDKALVKDDNEVQEIADNILTKFDILEEEILGENTV